MDEKLEIDVGLKFNRARQEVSSFVKDLQKQLNSIKANVNLTSSSGGGGSRSSGNSSGGGGGGGGGSVLPNADKDLQKLTQLNEKLKSLQGIAARLATTPGMSGELAKVEQKQAAIIAQIREATKLNQTQGASVLTQMRQRQAFEEQYIQSLRQENQLRTQSNERQGGRGTQFSPHSERQSRLLRGGSSGGGGGGGGMSMMGAGVAGGLAMAGAAILKITIDAIGELGKQAQETAKIFADSGGKFSQLRGSQEGLNYAKTKAGNNPYIVKGEQLKNELEGRFWGGLDRAITAFGDAGKGISDIFKDEKTKAAEKKKADEEAKKPITLTGDTKIEYDTMKRDRIEMERDIAIARKDFEQDIFQTRRDYSLELKEFERGIFQERRDLALEEKETELQFARQKQDIERSAAIEQRDYSLARQKLDEDFDFKQSEKKFANDRDVANREHNNKKSDAKDDFDLKQGYAAKELERDARIRKEDTQKAIGDKELEYGKEREIKERDFAIGQSNKGRDFAIGQGDKSQDFGKSQADKSQDFGKNQARNAEDFKDKLADMRISGASAISYYQTARDYRKQQGRDSQDFSIEQGRNKRDFGIEQGRDARGFKIGQSDDKTAFVNQQKDAAKNIGIEIAKAIRDSMIEQMRANEKFGIDREKDTKEFGIGQSRSDRDFGNQETDALRARAMEVESHYYELRYQSIELENRHKDALEQTNIELERLAEDLSIAREKLSNKKSDLDFQEATGREKLKNKKDDLDFSQGQAREKLDIGNSQARRGQSESEQAFAENLFNTNPDMFMKLTENPEYKWMRQAVDAMRKRKGYASGGFIEQDQVANVHKGEYIINPTSPNQSRQQDLLRSLTQAMPVKGGGGSSDIISPMSLQSLGGGGNTNINVGGSSYNVSGLNGGSVDQLKSLVDTHNKGLETKISKFMGNLPNQLAQFEKFGHRV